MYVLYIYIYLSNTNAIGCKQIGYKNFYIVILYVCMYVVCGPLAMQDSKEEVRSILVESIVEVRRGVQSAVLQRAGLVDPNCCLSIIHTSYTSASDTSRCYLQ